MKMEDFYNLEDRNNDITSEYSSDESSYYSVSSSPDIPSYEEFNNYDYSTENRCSSVSSGTYEPVIGQINQTFYPAPAYWIEVLGVFPTELRGTTFYNPLFYYVPMYSDLYCPLSPDLGQNEYETESTDYCSTDSDTEFSSLSSETYYTAEEDESYFDPGEFKSETEEFGYLNDTYLETINFEVLANDEYEPIKDKQFLASESLKSNYEEQDYDDILQKNEINVKARKSECLSNYELNMDNGPCGSENSSSICEEIVYKDILSQIDNSFEREISKWIEDLNSESCSNMQHFSPSDSARSCDDTGLGDITLSKISMLGNSAKESSVDDIKNDNVDKHRPLSIRDISERRESEKCSMNTFEFGDVDKMDSHTQGLKKCSTFEDLSSEKTKQYCKKIDTLEDLSGFDEKEIYDKDLQCKNSEKRTDNYECDKKKPKKKKMERIREFLARIFCCVKPP